MPPIQKYKKCKKYETCQNSHLQQLIILEGFSQNGHHHLFQRMFLRRMALVNIYFRHVFDYDMFLTFESLKTIFCWCFEGLGLCWNDFSKRKASDCIYQSRNMYRETHFLAMYHGYVSWICIMAMYHGFVSWFCIMAMYHMLQTRRETYMGNDRLRIQGCQLLKSALNLVLIADSESTQKAVQIRTGIIDS